MPMTGDSLVRLLLNIADIQTALACALVHKLPAAMEAQCSQEADSMPGRILGSLRWYPTCAPHILRCPCLGSTNTHNSVPAVNQIFTFN